MASNKPTPVDTATSPNPLDNNRVACQSLTPDDVGTPESRKFEMNALEAEPKEIEPVAVVEATAAAATADENVVAAADATAAVEAPTVRPSELFVAKLLLSIAYLEVELSEAREDELKAEEALAEVRANLFNVEKALSEAQLRKSKVAAEPLSPYIEAAHASTEDTLTLELLIESMRKEAENRPGELEAKKMRSKKLAEELKDIKEAFIPGCVSNRVLKDFTDGIDREAGGWER